MEIPNKGLKVALLTEMLPKTARYMNAGIRAAASNANKSDIKVYQAVMICALFVDYGCVPKPGIKCFFKPVK